MPPRTWPFRPVLGALLFGTAFGSACAANDDEALRRDVLAHLADDVFVPVHAAVRDDAAALAAAVAAACTGADANTDHAWRALRGTWSIRGAFVLGPVVTQMQAPSLDFWPVRPDAVDAAITAVPATIDAAYIDSLGTSAKGIPAVEYLLYTAAIPPDTPRCAYLTALADDIAARTAALADAWPAEAAAFKATDTQAALDTVVNATIENLYAMVKTKLDRPLGNLTGSDPDPALVESFFSANSLTDLDCNLDGFTLVYLGADAQPGGPGGLGALVADRDPDLDARILAQLGLARAALHAIPPPLADALLTDRSAVQTARDEIDALRRLIKLDVASLLNVTLSLSDNDGD